MPENRRYFTSLDTIPHDGRSTLLHVLVHMVEKHSQQGQVKACAWGEQISHFSEAVRHSEAQCGIMRRSEAQ